MYIEDQNEDELMVCLGQDEKETWVMALEQFLATNGGSYTDRFLARGMLKELKGPGV